MLAGLTGLPSSGHPPPIAAGTPVSRVVSFEDRKSDLKLTIALTQLMRKQGGRTRWDWTRTVRGWHSAPRVVGCAEFDERTPFWARVRVRPRRGMAVIHFPSTTAATGGLTDPNARHEGEDAVDTKYIAQTFIWNVAPPAHVGFEFLEDENLPVGWLDPVDL